jgi:hypothetical protein
VTVTAEQRAAVRQVIAGLQHDLEQS